MKLLFFLLCSVSTIVYAQNTRTLENGMQSPKASLEQVAWLAGHWKGEAFGGISEEIWSPASGGSMMFSFRLIVDEGINFYEFGHIQEKNGTLMMQLKHFGDDLKGWENKDETIDFALIEVETDRLYFDGYTLERISDQEINMYVVIGEDDGTQNEVKFNYRRQ